MNDKILTPFSSLFQAKYVDGLLNPSHRKLSFTIELATSESFLVSFVRETTLLINALLSQRCEEFGFMVISFLNILKFFNNQPLLVKLDPVTQPLVVMLGANSQPL